MDEFLLVFRAVAAIVIATWSVALLRTRGKPPDWEPAQFSRERWPFFRVTRNRYRMAAIAGIVAGLGVLAYSFVLAALWA
jgi:hypothetical protein